jgi:hypothetical protein
LRDGGHGVGRLPVAVQHLYGDPAARVNAAYLIRDALDKNRAK